MTFFLRGSVPVSLGCSGLPQQSMTAADRDEAENDGETQPLVPRSAMVPGKDRTCPCEDPLSLNNGKEPLSVYLKVLYGLPYYTCSAGESAINLGPCLPIACCSLLHHSHSLPAFMLK